MTNHFLSFLLLCSIVLKSQIIPVDSVSDKFKYEQVFKAEGIKQAEIYERSKNWIVRTLKSSDNIINLDDTNKDALNATGNLLLEDQQNGLIKYSDVILNFKFSVYCKEGRYKVIVDNFVINYSVGSAMSSDKQRRTMALEQGYKKEGLVKGKQSTEKTYIELNDKINKMLSDLKSSFISNKMPGDKGDW